MPSLPPVTKALLLICTAVFCLQQVAPFLDTLLALWPITSGRFWPWQLGTYAFLHGSFEHLLFNMLGLHMFGADVERIIGPRRFALLYVASVICAALAQLAVNAVTASPWPTVGASGGLFALLLGTTTFGRYVYAIGGNPEAALLVGIPVNAIWALPSIGWLMLVSSWARGKPFLWAVFVPVIAGILLTWFDALSTLSIPDTWYWKEVFARGLFSIFPWTFDASGA